jgi:hypothetical protein
VAVPHPMVSYVYAFSNLSTLVIVSVWQQRNFKGKGIEGNEIQRISGMMH